ncbi:hypothetical protein BJ742DRAFT_779151 [Cladochytrium replicatum]|nr:hypothetical protein BJ742DRAFT_779151 [Cladochytrium replicatum]
MPKFAVGRTPTNAAKRTGVRTLYVVCPERPVAPPRVAPPATADVSKGKRRGAASTAKGPMNPAYREALKVLEAKQGAIKSRIAELKKRGGDATKKTELEVEFQYSLLDTHKAFQKGRGVTPVYAKMHEERFRSYVIPQLLEEATEAGVVGDAILHRIVPEVNLEVNFFKHETLHSPEIVITTNDESTPSFTLMLVDLDRPNEERKQYEECTDIPVTQRLVIPSKKSPYVDMTKIPVLDRSLNTSGYFPPPPVEVSEPVPGNTVLPYVPLHPAYSDQNMCTDIFGAQLEGFDRWKCTGIVLTCIQILDIEGTGAEGLRVLAIDMEHLHIQALGVHEPVYGRPGQSKTQKAFRIQSAQEVLQRSPVPVVLGGLGSKDRFASTAPGLPTMEDPNPGALTSFHTLTVMCKSCPKPHPDGDAALAWQRNVTGKTPGITAVAAAANVRTRERIGAVAPFLGPAGEDGGEKQGEIQITNAKTWVPQVQPRGNGRSRFQNV